MDADAGSRYVACAWCSRLSSDGGAWFHPQPWHVFLRRREQEARLSHGICPPCFAELAPETPYPSAP